MKEFIERWFRRGEPPAPAPSSQLTHRDIESYYLHVISDALRRMMVPPEAVTIQVRRAGSGPTGLTAFAAYVRILRWDPLLTPVLLQNMPVIDGRIRKVAQASVILEHTHFAGVWFQATSEAEGAPRHLLGVPAEIMWQSELPQDA